MQEEDKYHAQKAGKLNGMLQLFSLNTIFLTYLIHKLLENKIYKRMIVVKTSKQILWGSEKLHQTLLTLKPTIVTNREPMTAQTGINIKAGV